MTKETIGYISLAAITIAIAIVLSITMHKLLGIFIKRYAKKLNADPTNFAFLKNSMGVIIYTLALIFIFYQIPYLKAIGTTLFAGAGILAVAIGFASQKAFSNIISGIFILGFKPFRIGEVIEFTNGQKGVVDGITLRHTIIRDFENRRIIIPNSIISEETIINSSIEDEKIKKQVVFSISYESNIDTAMKIIREEAEKHPLTIDTRSKEEIDGNHPIVDVRVVSLAEYSVNLKAYIWAKNFNDAFIMSCDLLKSVKERFDLEGIEIPYPHRTIVHKKDVIDG